MDMIAIGSKIKEARERAHLTQEELAEIVGTKEISQASDYAFTHHEVSNFFDRFHINQSF